MAVWVWRQINKILLKKKPYVPEIDLQTNLKRCLNGWDVGLLGVGSTLGVGVYLLTGHVALHMAGPSIVLSFTIAALAAMMSGLCYGELSSKIPRAGAAYNYAYVALGELIAFLLGWGNIIESVFGTASLAKGLSMHIDHISNYTMTNWFQKVAPLDNQFTAPYFDWTAFLVILFVGGLLMCGVREAMMFNNICVVLSIVVIVLVVGAGAFAADSFNWNIPSEQVPAGYGEGGFFPYGIWGTLTGAAVCFYAFVGFEAMCCTAEEVKDPRRVIPMSVVLVVLSLLVLNLAIATVVTMIVPYFSQNTFNAVAAVFPILGWEWARLTILIATLFALYAGVYGAFFPLPRILYSMSSDGFFGSFFCSLSFRQSPIWATTFATIIVSIVSGLFELQPLILMMCVGTLFSYTTVAICVIILRYRSNYTPGQPKYFRQIIGLGKFPTLASAQVIYTCLALYIAVCVAISVLSTAAEYLVIPNAVLHGIALILVLVMSIQPQTKEESKFKTPLVPLVPCLSIYANMHLMIFINAQTWTRAGGWILAGIMIYITSKCCCDPRSSVKSKTLSETDYPVAKNGKPAIQIVVESPTPPGTMTVTSNNGGYSDVEEDEDFQQADVGGVKESDGCQEYDIVEENLAQGNSNIPLYQAFIENSEEKEAKIIDLLDQVLRAEEDTYEEIIILKENKSEDETQRVSLGELSDAGSDASLGNLRLSKYDVVAQVHREDFSKVNEENKQEIFEEAQDFEKVTAFIDSDTNSRTDESGYSDTIHRNNSCESFRQSKEEIRASIEGIKVEKRGSLEISNDKINESPVKSEEKKRVSIQEPKDKITESVDKSKEKIPYIPPPPPMNESYFKYIPAPMTLKISKSSNNPSEEVEEPNKPRQSVTSTTSTTDGNIIFGSDRQIHFMSKLNNIFQSKIYPSSDEEDSKKPSPPPPLPADNDSEPGEKIYGKQKSEVFEALKTEIKTKQSTSLRPVILSHNIDTESEEELEQENPSVVEKEPNASKDTTGENDALSKDEIKSKLEFIYAAGGPHLYKPRLKKVSLPLADTSEEPAQTESITDAPKKTKQEKNDTLKRQRDKFSVVLNSIRLSIRDDDK